jgi:hypothetical protein
MKVPVCTNAGCMEKCLPRWASIASVCLGSLLVGGIIGYRFGVITKDMGLDDVYKTEVLIGFIAIVGFTLIAIIFALFERFDHPVTAFIYGASAPGLVFGIANLLAAH